MDTRLPTEFDVEALLDRHAALLQHHEAERASALAGGCDPALAQLLKLAEQVQDALVPVMPAAQFRHRLGDRLEAEATRRQRASSLARRAAALSLPGRALVAFRRSPVRSLAGGSAALALVGVTALLLRERAGQAAAGSSG